MAGNLPCSALSESDARNLLLKIKHKAFRANISIMDHPTSRLHGIMGNICIIPEWMPSWSYTVMPYLRKCVYTLYDPWCQLLYISEDCSELSWDYYEGYCVSNVPPSMLGVDMGKIERRFSELHKRKSLTSIDTEGFANEISEDDGHCKESRTHNRTKENR